MWPVVAFIWLDHSRYSVDSTELTLISSRAERTRSGRQGKARPWAPNCWAKSRKYNPSLGGLALFLLLPSALQEREQREATAHVTHLLKSQAEAVRDRNQGRRLTFLSP